MKRIFFCLIILSSFVFAYKQHVHQYISLQAYNLLKYQLGGDIRIMKDRIGGLESYYVGPGPWQLGFITTGAWREDMEDVVYGYSNYHLPAGASLDFFKSLIKFANNNNEYYSSITHFWYADDGDNTNTTMTAGAHILGVLAVETFTMENAYQKMVAFANGGFDLNIELILYGFPTQPDGSGYCATQRAIVTFHYNSLIDLYKNTYVTKVTWLTGQQTIYNNPIKFLQQHWSSLNSGTYASFFDILSFEILGRMCHLLQDMSVPAHTNIDPHGDDDALIPDYYEEYFGYDYYWDYQNTLTKVGGYINPYQSSNPLHFLMYTTNQMANHFATQGPHYRANNDYFSGNPLSEEISYLNSLNIPNFGVPTSINGPFDYNSIMNVRNHMFPQAIRATAGLLYWFAKEASLLPMPLTSVSIGGDVTLYAGVTCHWYVGLLNGIEPFTYNWQIMCLDGVGYLQTYESVKKGKKAKDKDKTKDGEIIINALPSNEWISIGTNSPYLSKTYNPNDLRDFKLRCIVTDATSTTKTSNELYIDVVSYPPPEFSVVQSNYEKQETSLAKEHETTQTPINYFLEQNYPNPFNPLTRIHYSLPEDSFVTLKVFNLLGQEIVTLVSETKSAGKYEVEFNAAELPSGTYIYKLTAGNNTSIKKMLLIK